MLFIQYWINISKVIADTIRMTIIVVISQLIYFIDLFEYLWCNINCNFTKLNLEFFKSMNPNTKITHSNGKNIDIIIMFTTFIIINLLIWFNIQNKIKNKIFFLNYKIYNILNIYSRKMNAKCKIFYLSGGNTLIKLRLNMKIHRLYKNL